MAKMTYAEFLRELAENVNEEFKYLCSHLNGTYLQLACFSPSAQYENMLMEERHIERLLNSIKENLDSYYDCSSYTGVLHFKGKPATTEQRKDWLLSMAEQSEQEEGLIIMTEDLPGRTLLHAIKNSPREVRECLKNYAKSPTERNGCYFAGFIVACVKLKHLSDESYGSLLAVSAHGTMKKYAPSILTYLGQLGDGNG